MEQLIKITSVPMQTVRLTQNARLVSSDSVDIERRKALARQISFRRSHMGGSGAMPVEDITRINRTFSKRSVTPQAQTVTKQQAVSRQHAAMKQQAVSYQPIQSQTSAPVAAYSKNMSSSGASSQEFIPAEVFVSAARTVSAPGSGTVSQEASASYTTQRGALEMRVSRGDLTFLPPMVMTIVTQRPELHFEYLGDFNYVPPRTPESGGNINLFT